MTTGDLLRRGAARVRRCWIQGDFDDGNGGVCAVGSLHDGSIIMDHHVLEDELLRAARFIVRALGGDWLASNIQILAQVYTWNDATLQNSESVANAMEYAALLADQEDAARAEQAAQLQLVTA